MAEMIKRMLKEHVIRPALRSVANSDLVKEAIAETLAEEEFLILPAHLQQQVIDGVSAAFNG